MKPSLPMRSLSGRTRITIVMAAVVCAMASGHMALAEDAAASRPSDEIDSERLAPLVEVLKLGNDLLYGSPVNADREFTPPPSPSGAMRENPPRASQWHFVLDDRIYADVEGRTYVKSCRYSYVTEYEGGASRTFEVCNTTLAKTDASSRKLKIELVVNPTNDLEAIRQKYEDDFVKPHEEQLEYSVLRLDLLNQKQSGKHLWEAEKWMLPRAEYEEMATKELAEVVFERPIIPIELMTQEKSSYPFLRLELFHSGFAVLRNREDMWQGLLHMYSKWSEVLRNPETSKEELVRTSLILDQMSKFYGYPDFKKQAKEHEQDFLEANLDVLHAYQDLLDRQGPDDPLLFFGEPCSIAQVALVLFAKVSPSNYQKIIEPISSVRWPEEQRKSDLRDFLNIVIDSIERELR